MRKILFCAAVALTAVVGSASAADSSNITLKNSSKWAIHQLFFSPANTTEWGPDQLGNQTIAHGAQFTLNGIPCDKYDVRLVDEDGDECVVQDVAVCANNDTWEITDHDLLGCQAKTGG